MQKEFFDYHLLFYFGLLQDPYRKQKQHREKCDIQKRKRSLGTVL